MTIKRFYKIQFSPPFLLVKFLVDDPFCNLSPSANFGSSAIVFIIQN